VIARALPFDRSGSGTWAIGAFSAGVMPVPGADAGHHPGRCMLAEEIAHGNVRHRSWRLGLEPECHSAAASDWPRLTLAPRHQTSMREALRPGVAEFRPL